MKLKRRTPLLLLAVLAVGLVATSYVHEAQGKSEEITTEPTSSVVPELGNNPAGVVTITTGTSLCSAVPIRNTNVVVTGAHCLTSGTEMHQIVGRVAIEHPGGTAHARSARISSEWLDQETPRADAAVLYTDHIWDQGVDGLSSSMAVEQFSVYGFQAFDADGQHAASYEATTSGVAECHIPGDEILWGVDGTFSGRCGMRSGASGGPVVVNDGQSFRLVGITSTFDGSAINGFVGHEIVSELLGGDKAVHVSLSVPGESN